jgi:hypothetical protein
MEHEERLKAALADRYQIEREIGSGGMARRNALRAQMDSDSLPPRAD